MPNLLLPSGQRLRYPRQGMPNYRSDQLRTFGLPPSRDAKVSRRQRCLELPPSRMPNCPTNKAVSFRLGLPPSRDAKLTALYENGGGRFPSRDAKLGAAARGSLGLPPSGMPATLPTHPPCVWDCPVQGCQTRIVREGWCGLGLPRQRDAKLTDRVSTFGIAPSRDAKLVGGLPLMFGIAPVKGMPNCTAEAGEEKRPRVWDCPVKGCQTAQKGVVWDCPVRGMPN